MAQDGLVDDFISSLHGEIETLARAVARDEIASLMGLVLRRLQDQGPTRSPDRNMAVEIMAEIFGEALRDFGATVSEPGE